ncbi:Uma2 family endonuclease [Microcoleus sp. FACHB-53]|nr:Uma2 family endonuclease [Microcoleus sp. FACHB-53]
MSITTDKAISLEEFLKLPETKPASEYINGEIIQKLIPKGKHSRLQFRLCETINNVAEPLHIASAFPELRCSFAIRSIVPEIAVFKWSRIPFDADGEPPNDFLLCPDWTIEILSPEQSSNRVIGNILYCLQHGCQLGWLIDPSDRSILVFLPNQQPELLQGSAHLSVLGEIDLALTVSQVFSWLKMEG